MKSLSTCLNKVISDGYTEDFKITEKGMEGLHNKKMYQPSDVKIVNFFRFEGPSDPEDEAVLYVIEAEDGTKGTLIDAYNLYSDPLIGDFVKEVEQISKKAVNK
ncbi:MAG TPA: hypothetical protein VEZ55_06260 [Chitinophagaceae bacterium]|nr:hypothetical protein [Chitinophagaceae bacterium]